MTFSQQQLEAVGAITLDEFAACLAATLAPARAAAERTQAPLGRALVASTVLPSLSELHGSTQGDHKAAPVAPGSVGSQLEQRLFAMPLSERSGHVDACVLRVVRELAGASSASVRADTPLMEAGVDSLAATELSSRLRSLTGAALSPTIVFEQPTPRAIAAHLLEHLASSHVSSTARMLAACAAADGARLAMMGMVGRWPGGSDVGAVRGSLQRACGDAMGSVPQTRWVLEASVDVTMLSAVQMSCVRHGGFVAGAQRFDAGAFCQSAAEAETMDPQQRLVLELGYTSLHSSLHRRMTLMGGDGGVFVGIESPDWALAQPPSARVSVYAVTSASVSVAAGRVSFALGLQGPC